MVQRWYVVQVKPKHEDVVMENLDKQQFKCFYPQICEHKKIRGAVVNISSALFPSYMFVSFDTERDRWRAVSNTRGVIRLLGSNDEYASPVPVGFVEDLMRQINGEGYLTFFKTEKVIKKYMVGDQLRVMSGIFEGFTGACQRIKNDYAVLLLSLLSGQVEVKLPLISLDFT